MIQQQLLMLEGPPRALGSNIETLSASKFAIVNANSNRIVAMKFSTIDTTVADEISGENVRLKLIVATKEEKVIVPQPKSADLFSRVVALTSALYGLYLLSQSRGERITEDHVYQLASMAGLNCALSLPLLLEGGVPGAFALVGCAEGVAAFLASLAEMNSGMATLTLSTAQQAAEALKSQILSGKMLYYDGIKPYVHNLRYDLALRTLNEVKTKLNASAVPQLPLSPLLSLPRPGQTAKLIPKPPESLPDVRAPPISHLPDIKELIRIARSAPVPQPSVQSIQPAPSHTTPAPPPTSPQLGRVPAVPSVPSSLSEEIIAKQQQVQTPSLSGLLGISSAVAVPLLSSSLISRIGEAVKIPIAQPSGLSQLVPSAVSAAVPAAPVALAVYSTVSSRISNLEKEVSEVRNEVKQLGKVKALAETTSYEMAEQIAENMPECCGDEVNTGGHRLPRKWLRGLPKWAAPFASISLPPSPFMMAVSAAGAAVGLVAELLSRVEKS